MKLPMPVFESHIDIRSAGFAKNRADHLALIEEFCGLEEKIAAHSARANPTHRF